ncbi:serine hydrolase domain-containing protein [Winogradskyella sediminis]|uniref:CubicO group peptidase, beta-lactamase class C family n=1 Tax=Winogradskyella sediminis TaxID=1382466 RepID=A0A1H1RIA4_9FLAO|nr:serine hydrolase domain-containing protein [Winogradskyella sediminis]SDS34669.1 CubicO group peptidase, beta-lactamase class C family [Winogradskyella sediminis]
MLNLRSTCLLVCGFLFLNATAQKNIHQKIDELLASYVCNDAPGLSVKVIHKKQSVYSNGFGLSHLDYNIKNSDSTVFSIASIAKQFTASAIWALEKEGKISLDDDIRMYLPEFPKYEEIIRIKHLLNHTSGIRNYHTLMYLAGFDYDAKYYDNNTVLELAIRQKNLNHLVGEKVSYSNTNYNLLAIIIERISGQNLNAYLKLKILNPLKMNSTFVRVEHGKPIKNKAVGYKKNQDGYRFNTNNQLSYGAGSMGSSINDMAIWMQMLNGQIVEFKSLAEFLKTTETLISGKKANYARGLMVDNYKGYETLNHSGFGFGGQSQLITVPEKEIGIIVLTNAQEIDAPRIAYQILDVLMEDANNIKNESQQDMSFQPQNLDEFIGEFKEINSDMTMKIFVENDTLKSVGSMGRTAAALVQYDQNKFHRTQSQNVKYDFSPSASHDMVISFGGTPFYFKQAKFIDAKTVEVSNFEGNFYSEELNVTYHFFEEDNKLKLSFVGNEDINLHPVQLSEFGNNDRTLYRFVKDANNEVTGMLLSCDGTVKDIVFKKEKDR